MGKVWRQHVTTDYNQDYTTYLPENIGTKTIRYIIPYPTTTPHRKQKREKKNNNKKKNKKGKNNNNNSKQQKDVVVSYFCTFNMYIQQYPYFPTIPTFNIKQIPPTKRREVKTGLLPTGSPKTERKNKQNKQNKTEKKTPPAIGGCGIVDFTRLPNHSNQYVL